MLKQIFSTITLAATAIAAATLPASPQLLANKKQKKKNNNNKRTKKRNNANRFTAINAIKEKDNNKKKAKAKTLAKVVAIIATATLKASDICDGSTEFIEIATIQVEKTRRERGS